MKQLSKKIAEDNNPFIKAGLLRRLSSGQKIYIFDESEVIPQRKFAPIGTCRQGFFAKEVTV